jgi:hypothetical protein
MLRALSEGVDLKSSGSLSATGPPALALVGTATKLLVLLPGVPGTVLELITDLEWGKRETSREPLGTSVAAVAGKLRGDRKEASEPHGDWDLLEEAAGTPALGVVFVL